MDKVGEVMNQPVAGGGNFFSYVMAAVIIYHLYKQFKEKGFFEKLEAKVDELKDKLDK